MLGLVKPISVGICGDAGAAARALVARLEGRALACHANRDARLGDASRREARVGEPSSTAGRTRRTRWSLEVSARVVAHASAADAARARARDAGRRDGVDRHRQHLLGVEQLSALRAPALDVRGDELRQLRLRVSDDRRREGRGAGPPGDRLRRRRRVGHELRRAADLRAREHPGHRGRVQQRPVGRGEEEPRRLLRRTASSA